MDIGAENGMDMPSLNSRFACYVYLLKNAIWKDMNLFILSPAMVAPSPKQGYGFHQNIIKKE